MQSAYVYLQLYRLFDNVTPVDVDCGRLCNKACCKGEDSGMFLFPGEEAVFSLLNPAWARIERTDFSYEYKGNTFKTPLLMCNGECDRYQRPLACRIFPLTPHLNSDGKLEIITDPRGKGICPMAKAFYIDDFNPTFVKNIKNAFTLLCKNKQFSAFMRAYSDYLDEFNRFYD